MIEAKNLTMVYGNGHKAVDDISFSIRAGEIVGFAGPNGAGKTTVIKMLTGILKPTSGTAVINGFDINEEPIKAKKSFAYIADNPDILIQLTGLEYLNFIADMYEIPSNVRKEKIDVFATFNATDKYSVLPTFVSDIINATKAFPIHMTFTPGREHARFICPSIFQEVFRLPWFRCHW